MADSRSLELQNGIGTTSSAHLDAKYNVADDTERDALITDQQVEVGFICYHVADNRRYELKTYPTPGSTVGVVWSPVSALGTEVMYNVDDVDGRNMSEVWKYFKLESTLYEIPEDNYITASYFSVSRTNSEFYCSFNLWESDGTLITTFYTGGGYDLTVTGITDWENVTLNMEANGYKLTYIVDLSSFDSDYAQSLDASNARFKQPLTNITTFKSVFNEEFPTTEDNITGAAPYLDLGKVIRDIRIVPTTASTFISDGDWVGIQVRYFEISATQGYVGINIDGTQYFGVRADLDTTNYGDDDIYDLTFSYDDFEMVVTAKWNSLPAHYYDFGSDEDICMFNVQVVINGYLESEVVNSGGDAEFPITDKDEYLFNASTERVLPYLYKDVNWGQSTKIPMTCFVNLTDHNDEYLAMNKVMNWIDQDTALQKAIPTALMSGDMITATSTTSTTFFELVDEWFTYIPNDIPILWCNGNHDLGEDDIQNFSDLPTKADRKANIHDALYNRLPSNYQSAMVRGSATDSMYYYIDVPDTTIRVISIDQFEYPLVAGTSPAVMKYSGTGQYESGVLTYGFNVYYSQDQFNFIYQALLNLPVGSTALFMHHIPIDSSGDSSGNFNALGNSNIALRELLKGFKEQTSGTITVDAIDEIASFDIIYDFTGRAADETRIFTVCGHLHNFTYQILEDTGIHAIGNIAIGDISPFIGINETSTTESVSNYGSDVLVFNEDTDELSIVRYGSRRTIGATRDPIGTDEYGFNFIAEPLNVKTT